MWSMLTERYRPGLERRAAELGVPVEELEREFGSRTLTGRPLVAADVAPAVVFLASAPAAATNGQVIAVDGGTLTQVVY